MTATPTRQTHRDDERINGAAMARLRTTARRSSVSSAATQARYATSWATGRPKRPAAPSWPPMCHPLGRSFIPTNGRAIAMCIRFTAPSATAITNGHAMMMAMGDAKSTATRVKAGGQHCAPSYGPFVACIKPTSPAMSRYSRPSPMPNGSRPTWYVACAMERRFARRLDMSPSFYVPNGKIITNKKDAIRLS